MAEKEQSLLQRLQQWLFGDRKVKHADQKERRDQMGAFMEEHAEEEKERAAASSEKRLAEELPPD